MTRSGMPVTASYWGLLRRPDKQEMAYILFLIWTGIGVILDGFSLTRRLRAKAY